MKTKIHNHASQVLVYNGREILSSVYDDTYPREQWRGRVSLIGGGQSEEDKSPWDLLLREVSEEFKIENNEQREYDTNFADVVGEGMSAPPVTRFASQEDIDFVRDSILENTKPYYDFLAKFPPYKDRPAFNLMYSIYISKVPKSVINCAKKNLDEGNSLVSEGFLRVTNLDELVTGSKGTAWITGPVLEDIFEIKIPNSNRKYVEKMMWPPKATLDEYYKMYDYGLGGVKIESR